ncbi:condensin subunit scpb [Flammeovirgaceae bacterium 311]|nr:condensin subunit scpb [Flammeovirgaceae bacterium 311]
MDFLQNHVEALIFCSPSPLGVADMKSALSEMFGADVPEGHIQEAVMHLLQRYESPDYAFELVALAGGYQFMTKPAYAAGIGILLKQQSKKRLSTSALETLSIIAYKQPITKSEVEQIRGVNCDYTIQKLLEKELVEIKGKAEAIGRPLLYGTSRKFEEHFGINSLKDLPTPKDFSADDNKIGEEQ